jgi:hypothetical protein
MELTNMKRLTALCLALLATTGCVDDDRGIRLLGAHQMTTACALTPAQVPGGSFNINSPAGRYIMGFNIESVRDTTETTVGGAPVGDSEAGDFISSEEVLTFESNPDLGLGEVRIPYYSVTRAGAAETSFVVLDLLPPATLSALSNHFAGGGGPVTVLATVKLVGEFGNGAEAESNPVTFPIVVDAGPPAPACPVGKRLQRNGPCGGFPGQDGIEYVCETDPNATTP